MRKMYFTTILLVFFGNLIFAQNFFRNFITYSPSDRFGLGFDFKPNLGGVYVNQKAMAQYAAGQNKELVRFNTNGDTLWTRRVVNQGFLNTWYSVYPINNCILKSSGEAILAAGFYNTGASTSLSYLFLFKYNTAGTLISKDSIYFGFGLGLRRGILDIKGTNDYYLFYNHDSLIPPYTTSIHKTKIQRRDQNNNIVWEKVYNAGVVPIFFNHTSVYQIFNAKIDDNGFLYLIINGPGGQTILVKLDPNGNTVYSIDPTTLIQPLPNSQIDASQFYPANDSTLYLAHNRRSSLNNSGYIVNYLRLNKFGAVIDTFTVDSVNAWQLVVSGNRIYSKYSGMYGGNYLFGTRVFDKNLNTINNYPFFTFPANYVWSGYSNYATANNSGGLAGFTTNYTPFNGFGFDCVYNFDSLYNTYPNNVSGKSILDLNNDCALAPNDKKIKYRLIEAFDQMNNPYYAVTDTAGNYSLNLPNGSFNISESIFQNKYSKCPSNNLANVSLGPPSSYNLTFYDTIVPNLNDAKNINYFNNVFAGETSYFTSVIMNNGSNTINSALKIIKDPRLTYTTSNIFPTSMNVDTLYFNVSNLGMDSIKVINVQFLVSPTITIADTIRCTSYIPLIADITPLNNYDTVAVLGNTYGQKQNNPNQISGLKFGSNLSVSEPLKYDGKSELIYKLNYKNTTGNVVKDLFMVDALDKELDIYTLKILKTSKNFTKVTITERKILQLEFKNANIPLNGSIEIFFSILPNTGIIGDTIFNEVSFYSDLNPEIKTNKTRNILTKNVVTVREYEMNNFENEILVYPNPAETEFNIQSFGEEIKNYKVYDMLGKLVKQQQNLNTQIINLKNENLKGIYIIQVDTKNNSVFKKIVFN